MTIFYKAVSLPIANYADLFKVDTKLITQKEKITLTLTKVTSINSQIKFDGILTIGGITKNITGIASASYQLVTISALGTGQFYQDEVGQLAIHLINDEGNVFVFKQKVMND